MHILIVLNDSSVLGQRLIERGHAPAQPIPTTIRTRARARVTTLLPQVNFLSISPWVPRKINVALVRLIVVELKAWECTIVLVGSLKTGLLYLKRHFGNGEQRH